MVTSLLTTASTTLTPSKRFSSLSIGAPTPPRSNVTPKAHTPFTPAFTPSGSTSATYRLLYRGALSLPDSHLTLDGLTFFARFESQAAEHELLENPLALSLESMRGRPSLTFQGTVKMSEVWIDESGGIEMDIHTHAIVSNIYFENVFCLVPWAPTRQGNSKLSPVQDPQRSEMGIKVLLGDSDGPGTTQMIIYARLHPTPPGSQSDPRPIQLLVARQIPQPLQVLPTRRLPRPDDPIPRKPPLALLRQNSLPTNKLKLKRVASATSLPGPSNQAGVGGNKRQKLTQSQSLGPGTAFAAALESGKGLAGLGSDVRLGQVNDDGFKVPFTPARFKTGAKGKDNEQEKGKTSKKGKEKEGDLPVDSAGDIFSVEATALKAKKKVEFDVEMAEDSESELEKTNKTMIKKAAMHQLMSVKDPTLFSTPNSMSKTPSSTAAKANALKANPEAKELWGWIYRGVGYALRGQIRSQPVDPQVVDRLIQTHISMYIDGQGGIIATTSSPKSGAPPPTTSNPSGPTSMDPSSEASSEQA
ncbi:hypothetical protein BDN72DRAFT_822415 [Pluteus cervinus]|uniref:Uncharacterized protein n=1 Tax=Pluteus cervinus TaxID=181527 RepID=A0ACD3APJ0_9AGAR|nr:hypothetical protein BDN72DRAFT_822415 [Pluteus cervinus]